MRALHPCACVRTAPPTERPSNWLRSSRVRPSRARAASSSPKVVPARTRTSASDTQRAPAQLPSRTRTRGGARSPRSQKDQPRATGARPARARAIAASERGRARGTRPARRAIWARARSRGRGGGRRRRRRGRARAARRRGGGASARRRGGWRRRRRGRGRRAAPRGAAGGEGEPEQRERHRELPVVRREDVLVRGAEGLVVLVREPPARVEGDARGDDDEGGHGRGGETRLAWPRRMSRPGRCTMPCEKRTRTDSHPPPKKIWCAGAIFVLLGPFVVRIVETCAGLSCSGTFGDGLCSGFL